jgi:hypothetical protein
VLFVNGVLTRELAGWVNTVMVRSYVLLLECERWERGLLVGGLDFVYGVRLLESWLCKVLYKFLEGK